MSIIERITDAAEQTRGHNLVQHPSFPAGSISLREDARPTAWKIETDGYATFMAGDGSTYVGIVESDESGKTQRIWQDLELPVIPAAEGRPDYWLNCQYDATFFTQCTLKVYAVGDETRELFSAFLKGDASKYVPPKVKLPRGFVPPKSDPNWHTVTLGRIDVPEGVERVRVVFETPGKQPYRYLYLKNVLTQVRLPALDETSDLRLLVEREGAGPIVQATQPFLLCQGATHRLEVRTPAGNGWTGQPASLLWMDDDLLPGQQGLDAVPPFNIFDGDQQDRYQPILAEDGASWRLTVDAKREAGLPEEGALGLGSYWVAPKHPIAARIGDFHYAIGDVAWNGVVPVIDAKNSATLVATVKSPFTPARPVENVAVVWQLNGSDYRTVPTDKNGHSKLEYTPQPGDEGSKNQAVFTATCRDALQQDSHGDCTLPVFATSPWPGELAVTLDGKPITDVSDLALRLTRKSSHTLMLKPKSPDSYFIGKAIALNWPAGLPPQLGISFTPGAGVAQTMGAAGISWTIQGGSASGLFTVQAEEVAEGGLPVPFSLKGVQLSANLADEAELVVAAAGEDGPNIFRRATERKISLVAKPGSPLANAKLRGELRFADTGNLTEGQVKAAPAYGTPCVIGNSTVWTLTGTNVSGKFGVAIHIDGFTSLKLDNAFLLSLDLNDEADLTVAGAVPGAPAIFRREKGQTVSFVVKPSSPLKESKLAFWLEFGNTGSLTKADVKANPDYGTRFTNSNGPAWALTGQKVSGTFEVVVKMAGFKTPLALSNAVLLSQNLNDEAELSVASIVAGANPPIFRRGTGQRVSIVPKANSPLGMAKLGVTLYFSTVGTLKEQDLPAVPAYRDTQRLEAGGCTWTLTGSQTISGTFGLQVGATGFDTPLTLGKGVLLSKTFSDEAEIKIDGVAPGNPVVLHRNVRHNISFVPKANSPLGETTLISWMTFTPHSLSEDKLKAEPNYGDNRAMTASGLGWLMTGENLSGQFTLDIHMAGFLSSLKLPHSLLLSRDVKDEFDLIVSESSVGGVGYFWRGAPQSVRLQPKASSPLREGTTLQGDLRFVNTASLPEAKLVASPTYRARRPIPAGGLEWKLTGAKDASGAFGLEAWVDTFTTPLKLATGVLMSTNLADEAELKLSGTDISAPPIFRRNQSRKITLSPKPGSPLLKAVGLKFQMLFNSGGTLKEADIPATPGYGQWRTVDKGLEWTLAAKNTSGVFGVTVKMDGFHQSLVLGKCGVLSAKIEDELSINPHKDFFLPRDWTTTDYSTLRYSINSPLIQLGAKLVLTGLGQNPSGVVTAKPGVGTEVGMSSSGSTGWEIKASATQSGTAQATFSCNLFPGAALSGGEITILSSNILDELELKLNDKAIVEWMGHTLKQDNKIVFKLKSSRLRQLGMGVRIVDFQTGPISALLEPPPVRNVMADSNGAGSWRLRCSSLPGYPNGAALMRFVLTRDDKDAHKSTSPVFQGILYR